MTRHQSGLVARFLSMVLLSMGVLLGGCGGTATAPARAAGARSRAEWTASELGKLDPALRARIRSGEDGRMAVKVFFHELPSDRELSDLFLSRLGTHAIGQLERDDLQRIAARTDVERIEPLSDVGYVLD